MKKLFLIYILCLLMLSLPVLAKDPELCPLLTDSDLLNMARQKSYEANITPDFRKRGSLAKEGMFYAEACLKKNTQSMGCVYYRAINRGIELSTRGSGLKTEAQKMVADFNLVLANDPGFDNGGAYLAMGYLYLKAPSMPVLGDDIYCDLDRAADYAQKALSISKNNPYNLTLAGEIAFKRQNYTEALQYFKKAASEINHQKVLNKEDELLKEDLKKFVKKTKKKIK